jgi:hypothetical protein
MCRLEDMRIIEDDWTLTVYVSEVDEAGQATNAEQVTTFEEAIPQSARPIGSLLYHCHACGQQFGSWLEAKLHITDLDRK